MLADDLAHRREPQTATGQTRCKKRFENTLDDRLVHAAPGVTHSKADIPARHELPMGERSHSGDLTHLGFKFDGPRLIHRLDRVAGKIENHLLQLSGLTG